MQEDYYFISHSSKDKLFVRQIDRLMSAAGLNTFFDERDIVLGDSIPKEVYSALERATHIVVVVSENSIKSAWVTEELELGKMKKLSGRATSILPILIDTTQVPLSLSHIKYFSFRGWQSTEKFVDLSVSFFRQLGLALPEDSNSLQGWLLSSPTVWQLATQLIQMSGKMRASLEADLASVSFGEYRQEPGLMTFKWLFTEDDIVGLVRSMIESIPQTKANELEELRRLLDNFLETLLVENVKAVSRRDREAITVNCEALVRYLSLVLQTTLLEKYAKTVATTS